MLFRQREKETERERERERDNSLCPHFVYLNEYVIYIYIYIYTLCVRVWKELQFEVNLSVMTSIWVDTFSEGSWWQLATPKSMSVRIVKGTMDELEFLTIFFFSHLLDLHVLHFSNLSEDHQAQVQVQNFWKLNSWQPKLVDR